MLNLKQIFGFEEVKPLDTKYIKRTTSSKSRTGKPNLSSNTNRTYRQTSSSLCYGHTNNSLRMHISSRSE